MHPHPLHEKIILAVPANEGDMTRLRWYADVINGRHHSRIQVVRGATAALGRDHAFSEHTLPKELSALAKSRSIGLLLVEWDMSPECLQELSELAADLDVPALFVRQSGFDHVRRVVVATAGGPHTLQQMWVAKEISDALHVPIKIVRLVRSVNAEAGHEQEYMEREGVVEDWTSHLLGIREIEQIATKDITDGIVQYVTDEDLLVMGTPGLFDTAGGFASSIPSAVAAQTAGPVILLHARRPQLTTLRNLFWGQLIQTGIQPADKREMVETLVNALVRHNQAPLSALPDLVERALRRERMMTTAVGCQAAFPHIRLPGFHGMAASMAICPEGMAYGAEDGSLTHFFFLFITSDGFCDEYLSVLGKIAHRMLRAGVREDLLKAHSPAEVLDVLDPKEPQAPL
ncbi:MAG: PTS sugar transporter subunit IIA [Kiritimatiellae bacterium]|nr:PTS sugar transporter subunit IIA [Kiritimatiellia bacterium]